MRIYPRKYKTKVDNRQLNLSPASCAYCSPKALHNQVSSLIIGRSLFEQLIFAVLHRDLTDALVLLENFGYSQKDAIFWITYLQNAMEVGA